MSEVKMKDLAKKIRTFLGDYAKITHENEYNGPDPYEFLACAEQLEQGKIPSKVPFSDWGSGCYFPYHSKVGESTHREIIEEIIQLRKCNK